MIKHFNISEINSQKKAFLWEGLFEGLILFIDNDTQLLKSITFTMSVTV